MKNLNKKYKTEERGAAFLIGVMLATLIAMTIVFGIASPVVRELNSANEYVKSKQSYYAAEAVAEDAYYRYKNSIALTFPEVITLDGATATATQTVTGSNVSTITSEGNIGGMIRKVDKDLTVTNGFSFTYAVQIGNGGLSMSNNAVVYGNVASNGPITGGGNMIYGGIVSGGSSGLIDNVNATGTAYAHTIRNSTINQDAYYQVVSSTKAGGTNCPNSHCHSGSADQATSTMPIPDSLVTQWETEAANGGTATCSGGTYSITSSATLGPKKIPCNLSISGNSAVLTLTGNVWVTGNITVANGAVIQVSSTLGNKSASIIADNTANRSTASKISLSNGSSYYGSGGSDSYVMLISMNNSAENSGGTIAIDVSNSATGNLLVYAPHGLVQMSNNVTLREVTAYKLSLSNNAQVVYNIGLAQPLFATGPSGAWKIKHWKERH